MSARIVRALLAGALVIAAVPAGAGLPLLGGKEGETPTLAPLLREVTPAVVNISVRTRVPEGGNPLLRDPFFRRFFDMPEQPRPQQSAGSGVIVDADEGYVVTNHHVVENAEDVVVTLKDRRTFDADVIGSDPGTDIALLRIDAEDLTALRLGDSDSLEVGDFVVAVGNPFGLGQTVTSGIVSALGRSGLNIEGYEDFIQTDASINPGNSGGALISLEGELVGINTAIIGPAGGNVGIGFAVPTNMARAVMEQLIRFGEVQRGRLGVLIQDLTPDLAEALRIDVAGGAVVSRVEPDSPAERAGLRAGDVVVGIEDRPVASATDLRNDVGLRRVGDEVTLEVIRDGERRTLTTRIGKAEPDRLAGRAQSPQLAGATFRDLERGDPRHGKVDGVLVTEVEQGSPAWRHGLRPDDLVVAVNRRRVRSVNELRQALEEAGRVVALNVLRGNSRLFIVIR